MTQSSTTLFKGGTVVTPDGVSVQDILVRGEQIEEVGTLDGLEADRKFNANGLLVLPGAIDTHVHFNDDFMNTVSVHNFEKGTRAAAFGGVTAIVDFANQKKGRTLWEALENKKREAEDQALIDWGIHPVITDPTPETLTEIPAMVAAGAPTFKCYMTYREEGLKIPDRDLKLILESLHRAGGMLLVHAEDNDTIEERVPDLISAGQTAPIYHARSRPVETESKAIARCIQLARETKGCLFIVHMASDQGVELVHQARQEGVEVYAETCTHYLVFTEEKLEREDGIKWICSPPLRDTFVQNCLWEGIQQGRIAMVSSDDAAYSWEAKLLGKMRFDRCPNGIPGVEPRLTILYSEGVAKGKISLERMVDLVATQPARLFGLAPRKGSLIPEADADIVLFHPQKKWVMGQNTLHMAADWSAYEGIEITGKVEKVFSRGEQIIDGDRCLARKGRGRYLFRSLDHEKK